MVDPVPRRARKISIKQRRNISRNNRKKIVDISRRERFLAGKNNHALSSGSLEETTADIENIAMFLVSQEMNVPPVSTTLELSMSHIDN